MTALGTDRALMRALLVALVVLLPHAAAPGSPDAPDWQEWPRVAELSGTGSAWVRLVVPMDAPVVVDVLVEATAPQLGWGFVALHEGEALRGFLVLESSESTARVDLGGDHPYEFSVQNLDAQQYDRRLTLGFNADGHENLTGELELRLFWAGDVTNWSVIASSPDPTLRASVDSGRSLFFLSARDFASDRTMIADAGYAGIRVVENGFDVREVSGEFLGVFAVLDHARARPDTTKLSSTTPEGTFDCVPDCAWGPAAPAGTYRFEISTTAVEMSSDGGIALFGVDIPPSAGGARADG